MPNTKFQNKLQSVLDNNRAFVSYRWPNSKALEVIVQNDDTLYYSKNLDTKGFVFAPFSQRGKTIIFPFDKAQYSTYDLTDSIPENNNSRAEYNTHNSSLSKEKYIDLVEKAVKVINSGAIDKVVLSRRISINLKNIKLAKLFNRLLLKYPNACVYLWHHPKVGTWLGATPEKLLNIEDNKLSTMALAGTQISNKDDVSWDAKERNEQQWVTDFITDTLTQIAIPIKISKPYNLKAGRLWHICTDILGKVPNDVSLDEIVKALHPTPAVAGLPKQKSIDFILANEAYNRSFYTGFLGVINQQKEGERYSKLFVNLRCMQIEDQKVYIYVGGGITKDSHPLSEWDETEAKSKTLLEVL